MEDEHIQIDLNQSYNLQTQIAGRQAYIIRAQTEHKTSQCEPKSSQCEPKRSQPKPKSS